MPVMHCAKEWNCLYCGTCGKRLDSDPLLSLLTHCRKKCQEAQVGLYGIETRLANPATPIKAHKALNANKLRFNTMLDRWMSYCLSLEAVLKTQGSVIPPVPNLDEAIKEYKQTNKKYFPEMTHDSEVTCASEAQRAKVAK